MSKKSKRRGIRQRRNWKNVGNIREVRFQWNPHNGIIRGKAPKGTWRQLRDCPPISTKAEAIERIKDLERNLKRSEEGIESIMLHLAPPPPKREPLKPVYREEPIGRTWPDRWGETPSNVLDRPFGRSSF